MRRRRAALVRLEDVCRRPSSPADIRHRRRCPGSATKGARSQAVSCKARKRFDGRRRAIRSGCHLLCSFVELRSDRLDEAGAVGRVVGRDSDGSSLENRGQNAGGDRSTREDAGGAAPADDRLEGVVREVRSERSRCRAGTPSTPGASEALAPTRALIGRLQASGFVRLEDALEHLLGSRERRELERDLLRRPRRRRDLPAVGTHRDQAERELTVLMRFVRSPTSSTLARVRWSERVARPGVA